MLTTAPIAGTMNTSPHWDTGRENLVSTYGEKIATLSSGFFVPTIQHGVLPCLLCYGGLITGKLRAWLHHMAVSHSVFSPSPNAVRSISDGYSTHMESTVMNTQATGKIRLTIPTLFTKTRLAFDLPRPFKPRVIVYRTEAGTFDIINQADGKHGVTEAQRAFMLDTIAQHGGLISGGVA